MQDRFFFLCKICGQIYFYILQIMVPEENRRNYTLLYHQYHLSDLSTFMSEVNFKFYAKKILIVSYQFELIIVQYVLCASRKF